MQQEVSVMTMVVNLTIVRKMRYLILITVIIACFPAYGQDRDFHIRAYDKCVDKSYKISSTFLVNDSISFKLSYRPYYVYIFKHENSSFGGNRKDRIAGDLVFDVVKNTNPPIFSLKRHEIIESTHSFSERDTLKALIHKLPNEFHKKEKLRYGLELDFYYVKDKKGNWNCIIPNGEYIWLYTFKRTKKSTLQHVHKEFFGILEENCGG